MENITVLKVPHVGDVVVAAKDFTDLVPKDAQDLIPAPEKKLAFLAL